MKCKILISLVCMLGLLKLVTIFAACGEELVGDALPGQAFQFPVGIAIHPQGYAFVISSNVDVAYRSGSLRVVDLKELANRVSAEDEDQSETVHNYHRDLILDDISIGLGNFAANIKLVASEHGGLAVVTSRGTKELLFIDLYLDNGNLELSCWGGNARPAGVEFPRCSGQASVLELLDDDPYDLLIIKDDPMDPESDMWAYVTFLRSGDLSVVRIPNRYNSQNPSQPNLNELPQMLYEIDTPAYGIDDLDRSNASGFVYLTSRYTQSQSNPVYYFDPTLGVDTKVYSHDLYPDMLGRETRGVAFAGDGYTLGVLIRDPDTLVFLDTTPDASGLPQNNPLGQVVVGSSPSRVRTFGNIMFATCAIDDAVYLIDITTRRMIGIREDICRGLYDVGFYTGDSVQWALITCYENNTVAVLDIDLGSPRYLEVVARVGEPKGKDW